MVYKRRTGAGVCKGPRYAPFVEPGANAFVLGRISARGRIRNAAALRTNIGANVYYIPRRIVLPFGYVIKIKQLRKKKWREAYEYAFKDKNWKECAAFFYEDGKDAIIILQRNRTPHDRKEDLVHELQHAMVEYGEYVKNLPVSKLAP